MDDIVALCKRRGLIFPASEIYGGINGFWDFGPLGTELKNNIRDLWWNQTVRCPPIGPDGDVLSMEGVDTSIIQNPVVWEASGHVGGFNDPMVDCRETKNRYRYDHLKVFKHQLDPSIPMFAFMEGEPGPATKRIRKRYKQVSLDEFSALELTEVETSDFDKVIGPDATKPGTLTEPRQFNLMFKTYIGAVQHEDATAYLRPETAQGIFLNFKNVVDTMRVRVPFGIAQIGRAFRNEVTPRNYIFRSREFEQMEIEWFCHPNQAQKWYEFWCEQRKAWWQSIGLKGDNLHLRSHGKEELAHYAKEGCGTFDIEYRFPFTDPGFGELEGVAHRTDFDLRQHQKYSRTKLEYFDQETRERYIPHVIEPSAGLSRGVLAIICEAYTPDPERPSKVFMRFDPQISPITAGIFPLVNKDNMPEIAEKLYNDLRYRYSVVFDVKQSVGKRYARMDEAGTPFCFTVDSETLRDHTVTVRYRDTTAQERIHIDRVDSFLAEQMKPG